MTYPKFKRGLHGYITTMRVLMDAPRSAPEIEQLLGLEGNGARVMLSQLRARKLIHIAGWTADKYGRPNVAQWGWGDLPDQPRPLNKRGISTPIPKPAKLLRRADLSAFGVMLECLKEPSGYRQLSEQTGLYYGTIGKHIQHMKRLGLVRIAAWDRTLAWEPVAMYQLGGGRDADRPRPKTARELNVSSWQKRKARNQDIRMHMAIAGQINAPKANAGWFGVREVK